jgi:polysaccharide export outer membrane protein
LEALSLAGGPGEFADKEYVTLMRPSDKGTQAVRVDLGDLDVLSSAYYYLLPNDVVYVPALRARPGRLNLELLSVFLTAVSAAVLVLTYVNSQNN